MQRNLALLVLTLTLSAQDSQPGTQATEPTTVLEGRVTDLRGEGVTLARVQVVTSRAPDQVLAQGVCDGEGFFRISRVPHRDWWLVQATSPGRCRGRAYVSSGDVKPVQVQLHDAATVRGMLRTREGKPVVGAVVRSELFARILFETTSDATTDAQGRFELIGVPLGLVRFAAIVPDQGLAQLRTPVTGDAEIELVPDDASRTSLKIVVSGLPEEEATGLGVSILPNAGGRLSRFPPPWNTLAFDQHGVCELHGVPDVDYRVSVGRSGFVFVPREIRAEPGKGPHVLEFKATALGTNALRCDAVLRDPDGKPVGGVKLAMGAANSGTRAEATSAADGTLSFASQLAAGTDVVVHTQDDRWVLDQRKAEGHQGLRDFRFLVHHECKADPSATLELRVVPACSVMGHVKLTDGRPASFVSVQLEEENVNRMPLWMRFAWTTTNRDGHYELRGLHHVPNRVRIMVESLSGAANGEPFALAHSGTRHAAGELTLSPPATVEGVVSTGGQKPAPGVRVWLRDWDFAKNTQSSGSVVEVITDRQGRYRFVGVPPGGAWLQILVDEDYPSKRAAQPFEVEAGKTYTFALEVQKQ